MGITTISLTSILMLYNYSIFSFSDAMLEPRNINKLFRLPLWIINIGIAGVLLLFPFSIDSVAYLIAFSLIYISLFIFYKESTLIIFLFASAFIMHMMAISAICISVISLILDTTIYNVIHSEIWIARSVFIIFAVLNILIYVAKKIIPVSIVKNIIQQKILLRLIVIWITLFNIYLLFNAVIYNDFSTDSNLNSNQIIAPFVILSGLYLMLFFAAKVSALSGYKEKSEKLEVAVQEEKLYRNSLTSGAIMSYEVNLTKNQIIKGFEKYIKKIDATVFNSYSNILIIYAQKEIFSEDNRLFLQQAAVPYLLMEYNTGKNETVSEYRCLLQSGKYAWVRAVTNFMRDTTTGDIKAITFVKNIDEEKKQQIELQYKAERDSLTGLYNKGMTEKLIIEHLLYSQRNAKGALFILDVDNFKAINDNFGHIFGDILLCELSEKLSILFRNDDIVGRIGGDEFIVFMKNADNQEIIRNKADEICKAFNITYSTNNNTQYKISGSIGIALFPENGDTFEKLYKNADVALYDVKNKEKNNYIFYSADTVFKGYTNNRTGIDKHATTLQKSFKDNRIEYIFKILHSTKNPSTMMHSELELITRYFNFDRGYIFETCKEHKTISNTFEWCSEGTIPEIDNMQNIPIENFKGIYEQLYKTGTFLLRNLDNIPENDHILRTLLESQGTKSMFLFGIFDDKELLGFIGFDNCKQEGSLSNSNLDEITTICNIITTFFVRHHIRKDAERSYRSMLTVINSLDSFAYVADTETYEIYFENKALQNLTNKSVIGQTCYKAYMNRDAPCKCCPGNNLVSETDKKSSEIFNKKLKRKLLATASVIEWSNNKAYFMNIIDTTHNKTI